LEFFVVDVEFRINAAFPVPLLRAQHLPDHGGLPGVVLKVSLAVRLITGAVLRLFLVTHRQIPSQADSSGQHQIKTIVQPEWAAR
jgi:hypothetical protein